MTLQRDRWFHCPRLSACGGIARDMVMAIRVQVVAARRDIDPLPLLIGRLGDASRARHAVHMRQVVGAIWPEPFVLSPPCSPHLSHDEALLAGLVDAAQCNDRHDFDAMAHDLLNEDARDHLWRECIRL
jgi:hypothetical protein